MPRKVKLDMVLSMNNFEDFVMRIAITTDIIEDDRLATLVSRYGNDELDNIELDDISAAASYPSYNDFLLHVENFLNI